MKQRVNWRDKEYRPSEPKRRIHINILALTITIALLGAGIAVAIALIGLAMKVVGAL